MDKEQLIDFAKKSCSHGTYLHANGETVYTFYDENLQIFSKLIENFVREKCAAEVLSIAGDDQYRWAADAIKNPVVK